MSATLLVIVVLTAPPATDAGQANRSNADQLVQQALEAELYGQNARRRLLLEEALRSSPQCESARWQSGHVRVGREWLTLAEAQQAAAEDPLLKRYHQTCADCVARMAPSAVHLTMARWCREYKLPERERYHWLNVLEYAPHDAEALGALNLCWQEGQLIGRDEFLELQGARRAARNWTERLKALAPRLNQNSDAGQDAAAWELFRGIADPAAIPALETVVAPRSERLGLEVVTLLGKMHGHWAAASLIRLTESPFEAVRAAAMAELKRRPLHQTVPLVLAGMRWPVQFEQSMRVSPLGNVEYESTVTTEGPQAKTTVRTTASTVFSDAPFVWETFHGEGRMVVKSVSVSGPTPYQRYVNRRRVANSYGQQAQASRASADAYNREAQKRNLAASRLLCELVGADLGPDPQQCLDWWLQHNEYEQLDDKPVYTQDYDNPQFVHDGPVICVQTTRIDVGDGPVKFVNNDGVRFVYHRRAQPRAPLLYFRAWSCFARGTPIWTQNGLTPVEQIQPGDMVLSQDPDTGELAFKAVLQATYRPPSPQRRIRVEDEEIATTQGHPFWVSGDGWNMAKELKSGQRLHALDGSWPIQRVDELPEAEAYNLVVDDFHTYFVGRLGLLVHDNNFRQPTTAVLPGLHRARDARVRDRYLLSQTDVIPTK